MIPFFFHLIYHLTVHAGTQLPALMWKAALKYCRAVQKKS